MPTCTQVHPRKCADFITEHFKDQNLLCSLPKRLSHPGFGCFLLSLEWALILGVFILCLSLPRQKSHTQAFLLLRSRVLKQGQQTLKELLWVFFDDCGFYLFIIDFSEFIVEGIQSMIRQ